MQPIIRHGPNKSWPKKNRPFYAPSHSRQMSRLSFQLSCLGPITSFQQLSTACLALSTLVADVHAHLLSLYIYTHCLCPIPGLQHAIPDPRPTNQREAVFLHRQAGSFT
jgi:hypothetical protein